MSNKLRQTTNYFVGSIVVTGIGSIILTISQKSWNIKTFPLPFLYIGILGVTLTFPLTYYLSYETQFLMKQISFFSFISSQSLIVAPLIMSKKFNLFFKFFLLYFY